MFRYFSIVILTLSLAFGASPHHPRLRAARPAVTGQATGTGNQVITTIAGGAWRAFPKTTIQAVGAPLGTTYSPALDKQGNVYVADSYNNIVVRIAPDGTLTLIAGNGNAGFSGDGGSAVVASLNRPSGIAIDSAGNLYIADYNNHRIRKVSNGIITTVAGTGVPGYYGDNDVALSARLNYPDSVAVDSAGNLYIVDQFNAAIREVTNGTIKTVAGSGNTGFFGDGGQATKAWLNNPQGVTIDSAGVVYIADTGNNRIRKVANGIITTVIGNGNYGFSGDGASAATATLAGPGAVAVDATGQQLFVADSGNNRIRKVAAGAITTIAGNGANGFAGDGGPATAASFSAPNGILIDASGQLFIADFFNKRVRKIAGGNVTTLAGGGQGTLFGDGGPAASAALLNVGDVAVDSSGNLYIADGGNSSVRKVVGGNITTVAGNGVAGFSGDRGAATSASMSFPTSIAVDTAGNIYVADTDNNRVRKVSAGIITTVAGTGTAGFSGDNGPATSAALNSPEGVAVDAAGNLYIADLGNHRVRKVSNGTITTVAGSGVNGFSGDGALATAAELSFPERVVLDPAGNLYIADTGNNRVRKVSGGKISTVAGGFINGADDSFSSPVGIAIDSAGNLLIADALNNRVRRLSGGVISTIAGNGAAGYFGDGGPAINAAFANPYGVAVDGSGNVYIADTFNYRVRGVLNSVPSYQTSPVSLTFNANAGSAPTGSQAITLASTVPNLAFTATTSAPWLIVTPASGSIPTSLQVSVDPSTLAAGTYQGTITISTPYANPATTNVAVALTVQGSTPAQLTVGTQILTFISLQGGAAQTGPLQLSNTGGGSLSYTAVPSTTSGGAWLSVSPASGTATPSSPASLTVTATPGTLPAGTYQGSIAISGAGSTARVTVTMSINNPTANILLSQSGLSFNAVEQGGVPLPQTFGILNTGQGSMTWSATASTTSGGSNWLKISPASGSVSTPYVDVSTVTVSIDPTGLTAGTYYGRIQVTSPAVNSPQILMVVLTVQPAGTTPGPEVRPTGLIFTGSAGASPGSQDVMLGNPKPAMDNYLSANIGKGYSYLPTNADVPSNQPTTLRVFPDFSQLQPGEIERGTITLQFSDGTPRNVTVLVVVAPSGTTTSAVGLLDAGSCNKPTLEIQTRSPIQNFNGVLGQPVTVEVQVIDACGNLIGPANPKGPTVVATFSNKDADLHLTHIGNGIWSGTWRPVSPASGPVNIAVTAFNSTTSSLQSGQRTWSGSLTTGNTPTVTAGGVVHAASALGGVPIAPGSLITIYGSNLADATGQASALPLPQLQNGTQVLMGSQLLPILYTSSGQINVQVPFSTPVNTQYQLSVQRDNSISVPEQLVVAAAQPGVFTVNQQGNGQGVIFKSDGVTLAQSDTPATTGETVVIYCTGLGAVNPPVPEGTPPPSSPLSNTVNTVTVTIGGQDAPVQFSGLTPGFPGLYQVNAVVPAGVSGDAVTLVLNVAGQSSPPVTLAIQ